ncbi:thiamine pyrophosphate-dependent enzyme [Candidatus Margulisiibacteriota bacterium]
MANLKQMAKDPERLCGGHRMCSGCGAPIAVRQILHAIKEPVVVVCATGCLEVATTIFPYTAWEVPFLHNAFENAAATASGVEAAYKILKKKGKISKEMRIVTFGGDGGTYDIGFQALSGMLERGHDVLYVCYNNEAYMNTGIQRSGATPQGASTTTAPAGKVKQGKEQVRKDLTGIVAAHDIPYVAQTSIGNWVNLTRTVEKAMSYKGPKFINCLQPCRLGWAYPEDETVSLAKLAADACIWPHYEVEQGKWKLTYKPREKKPVTEFLKKQGRFRHLFKPGNEHILKSIQEFTDRKWEEILVKCGEKQ